MDMWSFARRPFIGEEKIAEAAFAKDDRHVDLFTPRLTVQRRRLPLLRALHLIARAIPHSPTQVRDPLLPAALTMLTALTASLAFVVTLIILVHVRPSRENVTSMPSLVASAGVTMDERIRNLMRERGHSHLFLTVDDPDLEAKLLQIMETLVAEVDSVREGIAQTVVRNLKVMARMGTYLEDAVRNTYPEFPLRQGVLSWEDNLPPLNETLRKLAEEYDATPSVLAASR